MKTTPERRRGESAPVSKCLDYVLETSKHFDDSVDYRRARCVWANYTLQGVWNIVYGSGPEADIELYEENAVRLTDELTDVIVADILNRPEPDLEINPELIEFARDHDRETRGQHIRTNSDKYNEFIQILDQADWDIELITGIFSGGITPMLIASEILDLEWAVVRYSPARDDTDVRVSPLMEDRISQTERTLLVDDMIESATTIDNVCARLRPLGVSQIDAAILYSINDDWSDVEFKFDYHSA
jgi:adenine/guanine phosphoribosyltransferase-like PRPP-binding protein